MTGQTLGREDMLWHVYAHAFVISTLRPGAIRLLSITDLAHAVRPPPSVPIRSIRILIGPQG